MTSVIKIENLYKEYQLGVFGHGTLYRDLQSWWAKIQGKEDPNSIIGKDINGVTKEKLLALKDINMEVNEGDVLGIIGANGAGKSTLLKILSRITAPTKGTIKVKGRIASLLEVGTGFHPELTGRENIYLNGAINGMNRKEVSKKLEQIVDFAGVGQFLDTPVKRYSSGMHVRLGFSVAAHLDPDILVVDEVLAVGDAEFQKKAVTKMQNVSKEQGRTVLFVSHNMDSIKKLCPRSILLKAGSIIEDGKTEEVIEKYIAREKSDLNPEKIWDGPSKTNTPKGVIPGNELVKPLRVSIQNRYGNLCDTFSEIEDIFIEFECEILRESSTMGLGFSVKNHNNIDVLSLVDNSHGGEYGMAKSGHYVFSTKIKGNFLNDGVYNISIGIIEGNTAIHTREAGIVSFLIEDTYDVKGVRGLFPYKWPGDVVRQKSSWTRKKIG